MRSPLLLLLALLAAAAAAARAQYDFGYTYDYGYGYDYEEQVAEAEEGEGEGEGEDGVLGQVVGGQPVESGYDFVVAVTRFPSPVVVCGGVLITDRVVLTAATCVPDSEAAAARLRVHVARYDLTDPVDAVRQTYAVRMAITHPGYNSASKANDAGLLLLDRPVDADFHPLDIGIASEAASALPSGEPLAVLGWGTIAPGGRSSSELRRATVGFVSRADCEAVYPGEVLPSMVCASGDGARDACQGDSGGPLLLEGSDGGRRLVGLVSWGDGCARAGKPGVYASIDTLRGWILPTASMLESF